MNCGIVCLQGFCKGFTLPWLQVLHCGDRCILACQFIVPFNHAGTFTPTRERNIQRLWHACKYTSGCCCSPEIMSGPKSGKPGGFHRYLDLPLKVAGDAFLWNVGNAMRDVGSKERLAGLLLGENVA